MTEASPWWTPHVHADRRPRLMTRNAIAAAIREWFGREDFIEVETAALQISPGNETHLSAFATEAILLAGSKAQRHRWLPRLAMGEAIGCFALAEGPGAAGAWDTRVSAGRMTGTKTPVADGDVADLAVVAATGEDGARGLFLVDLHGPGVTRAAVGVVGGRARAVRR